MLFTLPDGDPAPPAEGEQKSPFTPSLKAGPEERCGGIPGRTVNGLRSKLRGPLQGYDSNKPSNTPLHKKTTEAFVQGFQRSLSEGETLYNIAEFGLKVLCGVTCQRLNLKSRFEPFGLEISVSVVGEVSPTYSSLDL